MRRIIALFTLLFTLSGCNMELREADMLTIVAGMGVDLSQEGYELTIEIARPKPSGEGHEPATVQSRGGSLLESMKESISLTGRRLYFTHADVLILSRETAEEGISGIVDALIRQNELPLTVRLMVSQGRSDEILQAKTVMDSLASRELKQVLTSNSELSEAPDMPLYRFAACLLESGVDGFLPLVSMADGDHNEEGEDGGTQKVEGAALFAGDKLCAIIDKRLTQCLLWATGGTNMGVLSQDGNSFTVTDVRTKIRAGSAGAIIEMSMNAFTAEGTKTDGEAVRFVSELVEGRMRELINQTRLAGCDPMGLGREIKRSDPKGWQALEGNWNERYEDYPIEFVLEVNAVTTGRTG